MALIFTGALLRHEIRVRREERDEADAAQARLVYLEAVLPVEEHDSVTAIEIAVRNSSQDSVTGVVISGRIGKQWFGRHVIAAPLPAGALAPKQIILDEPQHRNDVLTTNLEATALTVDISLWFVDAQGRRWFRLGQKQPVRFHDPNDTSIGAAKLIVHFLYLHKVAGMIEDVEATIRAFLIRKLKNRPKSHTSINLEPPSGYTNWKI